MPFSALAARVDAAWSQAGYATSAFAGIAAQALEVLEPELPTTFAELTAWLFRSPALPPQRSLEEAFGQPPVTVYLDERFFIELLFWHTGTTGIHQHAFTGAFRLLSGSSLHAIYDFEPGDGSLAPSPLRIGALRLRATEVLPTGSVRQILAGTGLIHSAFHLDNPSVTLVVRTHADGSAEYEYKPPRLAVDPSARDALTTKRLQLMRLLAQQPGEAYRQCVTSALEQGDAYAGVLLLLRARQQVDLPTFELLLNVFRAHHPAIAEELALVAEEEARRLAIITARAQIRDPDHRFFLALLLNLPTRAAILGAIAQYRPARAPMTQLVEWLRECCHRDRLGFELDDTLFSLLRGMLEGKTEEEQLAGLGAAGDDPSVRQQISRARAALQGIPQLRPLFC